LLLMPLQFGWRWRICWKCLCARDMLTRSIFYFYFSSGIRVAASFALSVVNNIYINPNACEYLTIS
jgi:hypothetical protein